VSSSQEENQSLSEPERVIRARGNSGNPGEGGQRQKALGYSNFKPVDNKEMRN